MEKGNIIFLNGVSSSGKTTLAKALQDGLPEPYYRMSVDSFVGEIVPDRFVTDDEEGLRRMLALLSIYHRTIRMFSDRGLHTVVDHILLEHLHILEDCVELFRDYPVLFVHVVCPPEELRRREAARGDRAVGQGEGQLGGLVPKDTYDITVDTFAQSTQECVDSIRALVRFPERWTAFAAL